MTISVGDAIPQGTLKRLGETGIEDVSTDDLFKGRKVILFGLPGAYTPTCHKTHLPGYVEKADEFKAKGVDEIVCLSVNDPFVMKAWADSTSATGKVSLLADWDASLTKAMGLDFDASGAGLGVRAKRFSMIVDDGKVTTLDVEEDAGKVVVSGAASCAVHFT